MIHLRCESRLQPTRARGLVALGLLLPLALFCGCEPAVTPGGGLGGATTLPPPPPPDEVMSIGLVVPESGLLSANVYEQVIRNGAARENIFCEVIRSQPGAQSEAIAQLTAQGLAVLIVVPEPDAPIGPALVAARAKLPVLLLDRPVPVEGIDPLPVVEFASEVETAKTLADTAIAAARAAGFPPEAPAVVMVNGPHDEPGRRKLAAFHQALDAAKVPTLPDISFSGYQGEARTAFEAFLKEHPEVAIVLTVEDQAGRALAQIRGEQPKEPRRFVLATFASERDTVKLANSNTLAAIADQNPETLARRAYQVAMALARGTTPEGPMVVETKLIKPDGPERDFFLQPQRNDPAGPYDD